ncbi:hypothetical protein BFF94_011640 [Burkholderia catarinensis]|nr:hypothetical protein BFF94_011640 [Burkholderia catarinensis]
MQIGFGHEGSGVVGQPAKGRWRAAGIGASLAAGGPEWHAKAAILPAGGPHGPRGVQRRPSGRCRRPPGAGRRPLEPAQISNLYYVPGGRSVSRPISRPRPAS